MFYGTLPEDTQDFRQVLAGIGRTIRDRAVAAGQRIGQSGQEAIALQNQAFADPRRPTRVTDEAALARLTDMIMGGPLGFAPAGITAYHGSPYLFRQFNPAKVGTGEGAQAYGVGSGYTAEARPVAEEYRRQLATKINLDNKPFYSGKTGKQLGTTGSSDVDDYLLANLGDVQKAISNAKADMKDVISTNPAEKATYEKIISELENLKSQGSVKVESSGYLYKGDIPDEILPKFLDWDKKFTEQSPEVKETIAKYWKENKVYGDPTKLSGAGIYDSIVAHVYGGAGRQGAQQAASNELEKIGLRGIRYLDQGSRGEGKGTSNFIPFRSEDYKIQEINDIPLEDYIRQGLL
jgi:hypothetical protein